MSEDRDFQSAQLKSRNEFASARAPNTIPSGPCDEVFIDKCEVCSVVEVFVFLVFSCIHFK